MTRVEILAVGNELLSGDILDTNFQSIARRLKEIGLNVSRHVTAPDDRAAIASALRECLARSGVVILTGGLGPTSDDLTRFGVADALGVPLVLDPVAVEAIRARFRTFGVGEMPPANEVQAMFPEGAVVLSNPNGTAPGFRCGFADLKSITRTVFVLPGPPRELRPMIEEHLVPFLLGPDLPVIRIRRLRTQGVGESMLAEKIADWPFGIDGVEIGYYPQDPGVDVKITATGADETEAGARLGRAVEEVRARLDLHIYAEGHVTLPEVLGGLLRARGKMLSLAESCTGGLAASLVTSVAGSSDYFDGGVITYSNAAKTALLGVPRELIAAKGAVSGDVAAAMADGLRILRGTGYAIAITGIAGPGGATEEKPVGLVYIAIAGPDGTEVRETRHGGDRTTVQRRSAVTALDLLRRRLLAGDPE